MFKRDDRVRIYLPQVGNIYGTVYQDHHLTGNQLVLVHIDGTRRSDPRWINTDHVHAEQWPGQYARTTD